MKLLLFPRFLSSLRSRLKLLHPSPNCSLREDNVVHVHFKEEIGIAELIPLVTTYIILFAYIYFSTRGSGGSWSWGLSSHLLQQERWCWDCILNCHGENYYLFTCLIDPS